MKRLLYAITFACVALFTSVNIAFADNILAFPGAEGFGRFATGARASSAPTIYHVTNLNDSGTGSFRDAVTSPNRIVVFDVSGIIRLTSTLVFSSNLTILGQTAPGEGVQLYGERVSFSGANNIIVRFMRIRMGINGTSGKDAAGVANGRNMIFDHMSVLWGRDECFSISWDSKGTEPADITIQNSIIGQGLQTHSCGGLMQTNGGVTLFRNLYIENKTRNPKVKGLNQYVNNVVYNWGNGGCYIMGGDSEGTSWADIENNYFIKGPWAGTAPFTNGNSNFNAYLSGNWYDSNTNGVLDGHEMTISENNGGCNHVSSLSALDGISSCPKPHPTITAMMSAGDALKWIIDSVGPSLPVRDEVDKYLIDELVSYGKKGSTGGITTEKTLPHGGTGRLFSGTKPQDSDNDGMPDEYEKAVGLNPNDAKDAVKIASNGYLNIENYSFTIHEAYPYIKGVTDFRVKEQGINSITIQWTDNADNETGYQVEMSTDGKTWSDPEFIKANSTEYTATDLKKETTYYFRVRASNATIESEYSEVLMTETIGEPSAPASCTSPTPQDKGTTGAASNTILSWTNTTKNYYGTVKYNVYFGTERDNLELKASNITATSYTVGKLEAGKTYYWRVDASNDLGTTEGVLWSFDAIQGGILFQTDFYTKPDGWKNAYGSITANTNIINAANTTKSVGGMVFGSGSNSIRIVAMNAANYSDDSSKDYGPYTAEDKGATPRCIQFVTTSSGGYLKLPAIKGPCKITMWTSNPDGKNTLVFNLNTIINGTESRATSFSMAAKKRMFKFSYTYTGQETMQFKIDANAKKMNINDIIIEEYVSDETDDSMQIVTYPDTSAIAYTDDTSLSFVFNQPLAYNGGVKINGDNNEKVVANVADKTLSLSFEALDINTEYTVSFPEGALTTLSGKQGFNGEITFSTCDFPQAKKSGDNHFGKAAKTLPIDFAPFNTIAPYETVGGVVQSQQNDYPHWVQASGGVSEDYVTITATSDKLMSYFEPSAAAIKLGASYSGTGKVVLKVQESRNPDLEPYWRTIKIFTEKDFPIDEELLLNKEARFTKLIATTLTSGSIKVNELKISDSNGSYGGVKGDANMDDIVDVADITAVASYILGTQEGDFSYENADVNSDGTIDIADITGIAYIILH